MLAAGGRSLVDTLHEYVVQLLSHADLCVLQLGQRVDHHCVVEVLLHHALKDGQVVRRELGDALVEGAGDLGVGRHLALDDAGYVGLALGHVEAELIHVAKHQFLVGEQFLVLHQVTDFVLTHSVSFFLTWPLRENGQRVEVLLTVEKHV